MHTFDTIIIGGGIVGLSCALSLRRAGQRVCVVERYKAESCQSVHSLGVLAPPSPLSQSAFAHLHRQSLLMFPAIVAEMEEGSGIPLYYNRCGCIEILPTENQFIHAQKEAAFIKNSALLRPELELLSSSEVLAKEPNVKVTEFGGLFSSSTARISVDGLIGATAKLCMYSNVKFFNGTNVDTINISNDCIQGITCTGDYIGKLHCQQLLVAAGSWSSAISPILHQYAYTEPVKGQAMLVQSPKRLVSSVIKFQKRYIVPCHDDTIALGSTTEKNSGFDTVPKVGAIYSIFSTLQEAVPLLYDCTFVKTWAGLRPISRDSRPIIGAIPCVKGLFVATGHYKIGFGFLPITTAIITDLMTSGETSWDLRNVAPSASVSRSI